MSTQIEIPTVHGILKTSISKLLDYENCREAYRLKYLQGWRTETDASNKAFGTVMHEVADSIIRKDYARQPVDADAIYLPLFDQHITQKDVSYSSTWTPDELKATGLSLARQFYPAWKKWGYTPITDAEGEPILGRMLEWNVGEGVILRGRLDFPGFDRDGCFGINDFKTPAKDDPDNFAMNSDQLTSYQGIVTANAENFGFPPIEWLTFGHMIKRKIPKKDGKGPQVIDPKPVPARTPAQMSRFRDKVLYTAEQIRKGVFFKDSRHAFNSPCNMCDFFGLCTEGKTEGLIQRNRQTVIT